MKQLLFIAVLLLLPFVSNSQEFPEAQIDFVNSFIEAVQEHDYKKVYRHLDKKYRKEQKKFLGGNKKQLIDVPLTKTNSIPHPSRGRAVGAKVIMRPAAPGTGVIAGGAVRTVLELAGVKNVLAKQLGSNNPLNNARAAINSLDSLRTFSEVAQERDIPLEQIYA